MDLGKLPVNAFDFILVAFLAFGIFRGRKRGMSAELLPLLKWVTVVLVCGMVYEPAGNWFAREFNFSALSSYLIVYSATALAILVLFAGVGKLLGGKLIGSDVFGGTEYYLGMGSGMVRYACVLIVLLSFLGARGFSRKEVAAMTAFQKDVYGEEYFPTLHTAQSVVFETSMTGPLIRRYLGTMLIKPTQPENKEWHQRDFALPGA